MNTPQNEKGLLLFNMSYRREWDKGMLNRNYHVAQRLIRSGRYSKILSIDSLPFTKKRMVRTLLREKPWLPTKNSVFRSTGMRVEQDPEQENLYHASTIAVKKLSTVIQELGFPEDLTIWSYDPFRTELFEQFPNAFFVFDAVDNWIEHPAYMNHTEKLEQCYKTIQSKADVVFAVSEALVDFFGKKDNVYFIPNGVDVDHFSQGVCTDKTTAKKVVGYHGVIQSRLNTSIIEYLADKHQELEFWIIGPVWKDMENAIQQLLKRKNVKLHNAVAYTDLPKKIACFDVAIIPHKIDTFTQSMNPLKMYEYLAAGKPIVSSPIAGADQLQDLITIAVSPDEFSEQITHALQSDSDELHARRTEMAKHHSWENRLAVMLDIVDSHVSQPSE